MTLTIATLFSGGEGVGVGARAAGLHHLWGIEIDDAVAQVARDNGFSVATADILRVDPTGYETPTVLHASPPCPSFSLAKQGRRETDDDIKMAQATTRFIEELRPKYFTLENVWGYRKSESWATIRNTLNRCGYWFDLALVNSADYGMMRLCPLHALECTIRNVPNAARRSSQDFRMIASDIVALIAMMKPEDQAMHLAWDAVRHLVKEMSQGTVADATWQELVKSLVENAERIIRCGKEVDALMNAVTSESASTINIDVNIVWLLKKCLDAPLLKLKWCTISMETKKITLLKILECILATGYIQQSTTRKKQSHQDGKSGISGNDCPLCKYKSVPQTRKRMIVRAALGQMVPQLPSPEPWVGWYEAVEDLIATLPASQLAPWQLARMPAELCESMLVDSAGYRDGVVTRHRDEPANTIVANHSRRPMRAFIVNGGNAGRALTIREADEPMFTIDAMPDTKHPRRAILVGGQYARPAGKGDGPRPVQTRDADEPAFTVTAVNKGDWRGQVSGRVVQMTPRALARFQSFPDSYQFSGNRRLDCKVIGMAVPPLLYEKLVGQLTGGTR